MLYSSSNYNLVIQFACSAPPAVAKAPARTLCIATVAIYAARGIAAKISTSTTLIDLPSWLSQCAIDKPNSAIIIASSGRGKLFVSSPVDWLFQLRKIKRFLKIIPPQIQAILDSQSLYRNKSIHLSDVIGLDNNRRKMIKYSSPKCPVDSRHKLRKLQNNGYKSRTFSVSDQRKKK